MSPVVTSSTAVATRVVIIVARDRQALYEYFRTAFDGVTHVDIILDRRIASDETDAAISDALWSYGWEPDVYDELTLRGFVVKRVE